MIPTSERPYIYRAFGAQLDAFLNATGLPHTLEQDRDYYYLTIPAQGAEGFEIQANAGGQQAHLILAGQAIFSFRADSEAEGAEVAATLLAAVRELAGPATRLRLQRKGSIARAWAVEVQRGREWVVTRTGRMWLYNYFGRPSEVVLQNVPAGAPAPAS